MEAFRQALGEYQRAMGAAGGSGDTTDLGDFLNLGAIAEVLQARRETLGDKHTDTMTSIYNMASLLQVCYP